MSEKRTCSLCGEAEEDAPAIHDVALCEKTELLKSRDTIKTLKQSVSDWRDAWYKQGDLIGRLSWEHHDYVCPHQPKSIIAPEPNTWLHPGEQFVQMGKLVYAKITCGWKLICTGASEDAATAVVRLMKMEKTNESE